MKEKYILHKHLQRLAQALSSETRYCSQLLGALPPDPLWTLHCLTLLTFPLWLKTQFPNSKAMKSLKEPEDLLENVPVDMHHLPFIYTALHLKFHFFVSSRKLL